MYRPSLVPIDPHWQQPLLQRPPLINPFFTMPFYGFHGGPISAGPIYQGMDHQHPSPSQHNLSQYRAPSSGPHRNQRLGKRLHQVDSQYAYQAQQHWHRHYQYQAPSTGPNRNQRERFRQAEPHYSYQYPHVSYGPVVEDRSTGFNPGMARIDARNNTGKGKVSRTPTKNLSIAEYNLT